MKVTRTIYRDRPQKDEECSKVERIERGILGEDVAIIGADAYDILNSNF